MGEGGYLFLCDFRKFRKEGFTNTASSMVLAYEKIFKLIIQQREPA